MEKMTQVFPTYKSLLSTDFIKPEPTSYNSGRGDNTPNDRENQRLKCITAEHLVNNDLVAGERQYSCESVTW